MSLKKDLEVLYHFTGNANDDSGNARNGTVNGATLAADKNSTSNQAYDFDGTNDNITLGFNLAPAEFTLSAWINLDSGRSQNADIVSNYGASGGVAFLGFTTGLVRFHTSASSFLDTSTGVLSDNTWHHVVAVYDGTNSSIYVDGVLEAGPTAKTLFSSTTNWQIGSTPVGGNFTDGTIDEVRIYSRALTQYEITQLYYGYDTENNQVGILDQGLELLYHFTGNANDDSGNSNNGTVNGAALTTDKNSVSNQAYQFDSGGADNITLGSTITLTGDFTISMWLKNADLTRQYHNVTMATSTTSKIAFNPLNNPDRIFIRDESSNSEFISLTEGDITTSWQHWVFTRNSSGNISVYADGVLLTTGSTNFSGNMVIDNIGEDIGNNTRSFYGDMDEVRVYSRAISDTEVLMLYYGYDTTNSSYDTLTGDNELLYHMTGNANDDSGNSNNGTVSGATLTTDKNSVSNQAYDFDGTNDDITSTTKPVSVTADFSISLWINADDVTTEQNILEVPTGTNDRIGIAVQSGAVDSRVYNGTSYDKSSTTISTGTWYHVVLTWDQSGSSNKLYLDGVLQSGTAGTNVASTGDFTIGRQPGLSRWYNGKVDEVRVYSRVLTEDEIIENAYNYDVPTMAEDAAAPSGYGNKVLGVASASIGKVNGVATANISKVIGQ